MALLSFADDAPDLTADQEDTSIKKKIVSSHDVLEDDPTLSRDVDASLAVSDDTKYKDSKKDKKAKAKDDSERVDSTGNGEEETNEDESERAETFDQRMRDQIREQHRKAKLAQEVSATTSSPSGKLTSTSNAAATDDVTPPKLTESERRRQEIQQLENDIRKMHNRDGGDNEGDSKTGKTPKVSLLQQERDKYKTRGEKGKGAKRSSKSTIDTEKERETLKKLSAFEAKVFSSAREPELNPTPKRNDGPPCEIHGIPSCESCYDTTQKKKRKPDAVEEDAAKEVGMEVDGEEGQVDDSDDDLGWMQHKLVFEKDLKGKEVSLSAKRDDINDYIVIDPLNKAPATAAALAAEQRMNLDKKNKRDNQYSQDRSSGGASRVYSSSSRGSSSRQDRHHDRSYRDSSSSSTFQKDDSRRSGYDRNDRHGRDSRDNRGGRGGRDGRDGRDNRDSRDSRDRDRRR